MKDEVELAEIKIRTDLRPGDIGYVIHMHGKLYGHEYGYGIQFENYVAEGLSEFYRQYDPQTSRVWICEHDGTIVGFLLLMNRGDSAQLRYFLVDPAFRGVGLGSKLINLYIHFLKDCGYKKSYLWTTHELTAAAFLYKRAGFRLTQEKDSVAFGKPVREQRYDLILS